jgi:hypothetical protein
MRREESAQIENERFKLEKTQVLAMRLTYEIENVVLRVALPKINSPDIIERYTLIEELEKTIFRQPKDLPRKRL